MMTTIESGKYNVTAENIKAHPRAGDGIAALLFPQQPVDNRYDGYQPLPSAAIVTGIPFRRCNPAGPAALVAHV